jgi:hypothetical protein
MQTITAMHHRGKRDIKKKKKKKKSQPEQFNGTTTKNQLKGR